MARDEFCDVDILYAWDIDRSKAGDTRDSAARGAEEIACELSASK